MSKKNEGKVTAAVVESPVVVSAASESKTDNRGAKKGVPHITAKVLNMTESEREAWLNEKCGTPEIRKEVSDRLNDILKNGRTTTSKGKVIDYASLFAGRDCDELVAAMNVLETAIENAKVEAANKSACPYVFVRSNLSRFSFHSAVPTHPANPVQRGCISMRSD